MMPVPFRGCALILLAILAGLPGGQRSPAGRPWPPALQRVQPDSGPLAPADALKTFYLPPRYQLELVASEPLVRDPVALDWDVDGRLWVVEMPGYMRTVAADGEHDPVGRVVVLEDADGDGRMDRRTVFAEGLVLARSLKVLDRGVLVAEPPAVWLMRDTDGDLRMDTKELVTDQYGRADADPQNNANGFLWALDNWMHTAGQSSIRLRSRNGRFEVARTLPRGQWGLTHDGLGRIYRNTNESALHVDLVPTPYYARNPHLLRTRGSYERLAEGNDALNIVWPVRPTPGTNRAYQTGILRDDGSLRRFTAVCAPLVYRGDALPAELRGNVFVAEPAANLVSRIVLEETATGPIARKAYARGEFIASTDERFRPVYLANAPDGTLYIADMYRGVIEHRISITTYLRDQILNRNLEGPIGWGRIYRVVHESTPRTGPRRMPTRSAADLVALLSHPNGWWRDTARRLLVERAPLGAADGDAAAMRALESLARSADDPAIRLQALWTLDGMDGIGPGVVTEALEDPSPHVRRSAVRLAERWFDGDEHGVVAAVLARMRDPDLGVRRQLAASLGEMQPNTGDAAVISLLERDGDDPVVVDAAISGLAGREATVIARLLAAGRTRTVQTTAAVAMLSATIVRGGEELPVQQLFEWAGQDGRPEWQRAALLHGAEIALLGAAMPGTPAPPRVGTSGPPLPCHTCPGGRAGPGGAYAFPRPAAPPAKQSGGPVLRLQREPLALARVASRGGELGARASRLLGVIFWPGKPDAPAPRALTAAERRRFDAGREIYRNLCVACHRADGRGQDRLAPPLIGSPLALAAPEVPVRVLLHGKEGATGLMPPAGGALDDEQIASVLTYIRREWGQTAPPVDPAQVAAIRAQTAGRARPWTEGELKALMKGARPSKP